MEANWRACSGSGREAVGFGLGVRAWVPGVVQARRGSRGQLRRRRTDLVVKSADGVVERTAGKARQSKAAGWR